MTYPHFEQEVLLGKLCDGIHETANFVFWRSFAP